MKRYQSQLRETGWNKEQDFFLGQLIEVHGTNNWKLIAEHLNFLAPNLRRSWKDCNRRWKALANGHETRKFWTEQEELDMLLAHHKYKNNWSLLAESLLGWDKNMIKNKFYSAFRRIRRKIMKSSYIYNSKVELFEIYYITSLIQCHLEQPTQFKKAKGRRGKDFIYSLVQGLTSELVKDYKERLQKLAEGEGTMEELLLELGKKPETVFEGTKLKTQEKQSSTKDMTNFDNLNKEMMKDSEDKGQLSYLNLFLEEEMDLSLGQEFHSPISLFSPQIPSPELAVTVNAQSAANFTDAVEEFNRSSLLVNPLFGISEIDISSNIPYTLESDTSNYPENLQNRLI